MSGRRRSSILGLPEVRYGRWDRNRDRTGEIVAGVVIAAAARGSTPQPPTPGLCWYWSDSYQENGYWDRCGAYRGFVRPPASPSRMHHRD
ncbi:MAG: hypothetical protein FAZ92_00945 [Accumulibacter sp.]|uniref:hypothetical protein n=1 Tax=Accumulibacter sp. TaxID=2053492 RepID=UPI00121CF3DD|nr:hypothetical protein [Accumulibacter sp.]QKS29299.1 MAG: hypothetical protein HT579_10510 [Candidatus Accumulibacter similis]TLD46769.1 MAG: hypothetical protein FAZ92_00945 [Accumulibacter sp.]